MTDAVSTLPTRTPYEAFGGEPGIRRLVDAFYDVMDGDLSELIEALSLAEQAEKLKNLGEQA